MNNKTLGEGAGVSLDLHDQRFGLEIEMTGITRQYAAQITAEYFGTSESYEGGAYYQYIAKDTTGRKWTFARDSSIIAQRKVSGILQSAGDGYICAFVSPICVYEDIPIIQELIRKFRKAGALVNSSCGIHVHVDGFNHTADSLARLIKLFFSKQDLIYEALKVNTSRSRYCKKLPEHLINQVPIKKSLSKNSLQESWYRCLSCEYDINYAAQRHYDSSRYYGLNLHSYFYRGTVEWRMFNSTLHAGKVKAYIQFCLAMSAQAINQKKAIARPTRTTNPKFTFRTWLLHLQLIGKEFETARLHLLCNLTGNSAWRYREDTSPIIPTIEEET